MDIIDFKSIERNAALEDLPDERDYLLKEMVAGAIELPKTFRLYGISPVKNQGKRGTCTAFSGCAIMEYLNGKEENFLPDLSEEYLFKRTKDYDLSDYGYDGYGAYLRSAAKAMTAYGACLEASLPYVPLGEDRWKVLSPTPEQDMEAYIYHTKSYASVEGTETQLKTALYTSQAPLLVGITLYKNYRESQTTGILPMPSGDIVGGHAMALVGWTETHFIAKNSWGNWGDDGYLFIPFDYKFYTSWSFIDWKNPKLTLAMRLTLAAKLSSKFIKWHLKRLKKLITENI